LLAQCLAGDQNWRTARSAEANQAKENENGGRSDRDCVKEAKKELAKIHERIMQLNRAGIDITKDHLPALRWCLGEITSEGIHQGAQRARGELVQVLLSLAALRRRALRIAGITNESVFT
jgi:hypothetical protein